MHQTDDLVSSQIVAGPPDDLPTSKHQRVACGLRGRLRGVSEAIATVSFEEFCRLEGATDRRHELVAGRVYAIAGGSERHDLAAGLIYEALAGGARKAGCRPFIANRLLRTRAGAGYYPDVTVVCGPAADRLYEQDPALVIEVLSPSTAEVDRREKAAAYAASPTLHRYVLVDPDRRNIEVASVRDGRLTWEAVGSGGVVSTPFGVLDVDAIHDQLDASATT
jgi:Uma2 family endonuclease